MLFYPKMNSTFNVLLKPLISPTHNQFNIINLRFNNLTNPIQSKLIKGCTFDT
jgi:hypothetical protein